MLDDARILTAPFAHVRCKQAFDAGFCQQLADRFDAPGLEWTEHRTFYEAAIADITADIEVPAGLVARVSELTGAPLTSTVQVTAQRMVEGQFAAPHTDRPLLGYESVRLVLQLNPSWSPGDGGELVLGDERIPPTWNSAFLFVLHPGSEHAIERVMATRRTVVFHFWHAANTPALEAAVHELFDGLSFANLGAFDSEGMTEEESHEAGCIAWCCRRWGREDERARALARYLTRLRRDAFDPTGLPQAPGTGLPIERLAFPDPR